MVRFESAGLTVSIMTFVDVTFCVTLNSLPGTYRTNLISSNLTIDQKHTYRIKSNSIYSNNPHNISLATLGDTLNITITVDENLSIANITLLNSTYAMNITGMVANASVTVTCNPR